MHLYSISDCIYRILNNKEFIIPGQNNKTNNNYYRVLHLLGLLTNQETRKYYMT